MLQKSTDEVKRRHEQSAIYRIIQDYLAIGANTMAIKTALGMSGNRHLQKYQSFLETCLEFQKNDSFNTVAEEFKKIIEEMFEILLKKSDLPSEEILRISGITQALSTEPIIPSPN